MTNRRTAAEDTTAGAAETAAGTGVFESYVEAVLRVLAARPSRAVVTAADGTEITAGRLHGRVLRLAGELAERGVARGSTVSLLAGNSVEALVARYAVNLAGARVVVLHEGTSAAVMARLMASVDCSLLLADEANGPAVSELLGLFDAPHAHGDAPEPSAAPHVLSLGPGGFAEDVLAAAARRPALPTRARVGPDDDWCIRHTGGTTGIPKGVRMSHGSYRRSLERPLPGAGVPLRYLACTSLAHLAGVFADTALLHGGSVVLRPGFEPGDTLAAIARERVTDTWLLPPLLHRLLDHPDLPRTDLSSLRRISYGGTAASPSRLRRAAEVLGPVLYALYGQTETQLIAEAGPEELSRPGPDGQLTVGRALPDVELLVRDADGTALPPGEQGEILVRSPTVMRGYWKQPELTAEVLSEDGWVRTGDIGHLDEDGRLYLVDRLKDTIVVVGGHVHPAELEELLLSRADVAQCAVFGSRDEDAVERVHIAVVPAAGARPTPQELSAFVTARKGRLYTPATVRLLPSLPLTPAGKPDKRLLRSRLAG
ncbi:class I adenylate-forming enzyme family protein [Streptomyces cacaoi]|uniref:class I adenylate-forming enzyme family protein n=1 Tax=Streptomyces cacaoi TaxID=1898 RepID=UPI0033174738